MGNKGNTNMKVGRIKLWRHLSERMTNSDAVEKESQMYSYQDR